MGLACLWHFGGIFVLTATFPMRPDMTSDSVTRLGHESPEPPTDGLLNPRGILRASSRQSPGAARVRTPIRRRIAVCWVCVSVLDAVVAEWRRDDLGAAEARECVTCGAAAQIWVTPELGS